MGATCYQVVDRGKPVGWVVAAEAAPRPGPGSATVLLTRQTVTRLPSG